MQKKDRIKRKRGNTSRTIRIEGEVLTRVSAFFDIPMWLIITEIDDTLYPGTSGIVYSGTVACFKMKIEHENLHRNKANNVVLHHATDQQLKRVVAKCSVWW